MVEAEEARRLAEEKAEEARLKAIEALSLEEELIAANRRIEESQRKLADVTSKNLVSLTNSNGSLNGHQNGHYHEKISQHSLSNHHLEDNDNDEDDDTKRDNSRILKLLFINFNWVFIYNLFNFRC